MDSSRENVRQTGKRDRLVSIVLLADLAAALIPATVAYVFFKISLGGYILFVIVTMFLALIISSLLLMDDRSKDEAPGIHR
jgi:hypothetical protein